MGREPRRRTKEERAFRRGAKQRVEQRRQQRLAQQSLLPHHGYGNVVDLPRR